MAKYEYFTDEKNRMVIAVSSYAKKRVKGVAIAAPEDDFNYEKGRQLAKARCDAKIAKKRCRRAIKALQDATDLYNYALEYKNRMTRYFNDSYKEVKETEEAIENMLAKL